MDSSWGATFRDLLDELRVEPAPPRRVRRAPGAQDALVAAAVVLPADILAALWRAIPCDSVTQLDLTVAGRVGVHVRHPAESAAGRRDALVRLSSHVLRCPLCLDPVPFADHYGVASTLDASTADAIGSAGPLAHCEEPGSPHHVLGGEALVVGLPGGSSRGARLVLCRRRCPFSADERLGLGLLLPHLAAACNRRTDRQRLGAITHRQRQVLELVAQGCTNAEIGARLLVSTGTVRKHLDNIFAELHVSSRAAAAALVPPAERADGA
ncbi:MAG: helix-turn-helix transcriptional regulator [Intrasporangium sp.]|uniref:helix-turn-helix transcriptional regulator n=1 Tax=Intrasporangium sp. TaxID=1925024 RepID=UPI00264A2B59|nr:helix-turn-helix transcriptional regulator [Intrasporangium sp.]MDN5796172.1 helix-turn-helix transcriptional regulator [Intrasporangium sp.]